MTQTPSRDWQKDMQRVKDAHHARTCVNQPFPRLAWQEMLPDPWEDVAEHWLQEAKVYKQSYEGTLTAWEAEKARADAAEAKIEEMKEVYNREYKNVAERLQKFEEEEPDRFSNEMWNSALLKESEAREQRLKEAMEGAITEFGLWNDKGMAASIMKSQLKYELSTLYPDTPAPKEGE
jgi:hypothetical protein